MERVRTAGFATYMMSARRGSLADATHTARLAESVGASWVVADGYAFDAEYQRELKNAAIRVLLVDDVGLATHYSADLILNQNLDANAKWYESRDPGSGLLLGPRYALIRAEFDEYRAWRRSTSSVAHRVLVTLGGSDPENVTSRVLAAIDGLEVEVRVAVGATYPHPLPMPGAARGARNMPELMAWADMAISAAGSTWCELAFMGLPALMIVLADNQVGIAAAAARHRIGINLGSEVREEEIVAQVKVLANDASRRASMSERGRALVDGRGPGRVVELLAEGGVSITTPNEHVP